MNLLSINKDEFTGIVFIEVNNILLFTLVVSHAPTLAPPLIPALAKLVIKYTNMDLQKPIKLALEFLV